MSDETKTPYYVVMVNDRHSDPEPFLFITAKAAIAWARQAVTEYARHPESIEESDIDGWLYHVSYSSEGDSIWVVKKTFED